MKPWIWLSLLALSPTLGAAASPALRVALRPEAGFYRHEQGVAVLRPVPGGTEVRVRLSGVPRGVTEPLHIHAGRCGHINPDPAWALAPLDHSGRSVTVVPVPLSTLEATPYAINVHQSAADLAVYVACGNLPVARH